jgi:acyl-CoA synthetase (AMP-forming)/AMP-acid ligase II/acyl carrier protein
MDRGTLEFIRAAPKLSSVEEKTAVFHPTQGDQQIIVFTQRLKYNQSMVAYMIALSNLTEFSNLVELAMWQAKNNPDRKVITFLPNGEAEQLDLTFKDLDRRARTAAVWFQTLARMGDRAIILCPQGIEFIVSLYGCLYAGIIPVLTNIPRPNSSLQPLQTTVEDSGAILILTTAPMLAALRPSIENTSLKLIPWLALDQIPDDILQDRWIFPDLSRDSIAWLVYTSGSTNNPKGVIFTHGGFLDEFEPVSLRLGLISDTVVVTWAPFYHIAGIYWILLLLGSGMHFVFMPTQAFMERPARWLETITRFHASVSFTFNFGLQAAIDQISLAKRTEFDLSSLKICLVGGERIRSDLLEQFSLAYSPFGFKRDSFVAGYGSTEILGFGTAEPRPGGFKTYALDPTGLEQNQVRLIDPSSPKALKLVGCGKYLQNKVISIVDPETRKISPPDRIGEIWVASKNISIGYWNRPQETSESFNVSLADSNDCSYYRSGDLGFFQNDDLVITGRIKDMVILHGKNYFSQDFENSVIFCHPAIAAGGVAAFPILINEEERLAIACEIKQDTHPTHLDEIISAVRRAIAKDQQQTVFIVALVKAGSLPRTPNGKLQRFAVLRDLNANHLDMIHISRLDELAPLAQSEITGYVAASTPIERALAGIWSSVLNIERVGVNDNFFDLGGDSLLGTQILSQIQDVFQVEIPTQTIFETPTVASMAKLINKLRQEQPR